MAIGEDLNSQVTDILGNVKDTITANPIASSVVGGGVALGIGGLIGASVVKKKRKKSKKKNKSSKKKTKRKGKKLKFGSKAYRKKYLGKKRKRHYPRTAGKRKDTSHKRIRMTKNGQPYIILANGRARFIKKRSASMSRKRKGGRY